jgi:RIO kinase 1
MPRINLNQLVDDDLTGFLDLEEVEGKGAPHPVRRAGRSDYAVLDEMVQYGHLDEAAAQAVFSPTYGGSHHEREWILDALGPFYDKRLITDVLRQVRGGKEATVYCCAAGPETGLELLAAKIYRPRMFRNLRNDARYREGRAVLDEDGKAERSIRAMRAVANGTSYGKALLHFAWMGWEYATLQLLHEAGADVPRPLASGDNAILMEYVGAEERPAPTLNGIRLAPSEAPLVFERLLHNVDLMLACERVHGDLSAYNVLYWEGQVKIIDFPQAVNAFMHPEGRAIFQRDVERLCQYFAPYGIGQDPERLAEELWQRHRLPRHYVFDIDTVQSVLPA